MGFRITGLPAAWFAPLFDLPDEQLAKVGALRRIADDHASGYPCRVSLTTSRPGDELERAIARLLADPTASYLHVHFAAPGCYAARVDRA
jgi:Protein of unknown function (DUF1203)